MKNLLIAAVTLLMSTGASARVSYCVGSEATCTENAKILLFLTVVFPVAAVISGYFRMRKEKRKNAKK